MSAPWVAAVVRARALARHAIGRPAARAIAASGSLPRALEVLADTPYGQHVRPGSSLAEAQRAIAAALLWQLRVLAGWSPRDGVTHLRTLASWFEAVNVEERLHRLTGGQPVRPFELGALGTAGRTAAEADSVRQLRAGLAASVWGDPGDGGPPAVLLALRASYAARVARLPEPAPGWAAGAMALLVAGERFVAARPLPPAVHARAARLLTSAAVEAGSLSELADRLPGHARWAVAGLAGTDDLWRGTGLWWRRVERDGLALLGGGRLAFGPVLGAVAVLAADAWRTGAALEIAARGGGPLDVFDAVA